MAAPAKPWCVRRNREDAAFARAVLTDIRHSD
jgi:hypothetical protein